MGVRATMVKCQIESRRRQGVTMIGDYSLFELLDCANDCIREGFRLWFPDRAGNRLRQLQAAVEALEGTVTPRPINAGPNRPPIADTDFGTLNRYSFDRIHIPRHIRLGDRP